MNSLSNFAGLVLCAGYGTRLRPLTKYLPKPLVPLLDRSPLWHQVMLLKNAGIDEIYINIHFMPDIMKEYIGNHLPFVKFVYEPDILGTGGGIKNIIKVFDIKKQIVVLNGDTITVADIKQIVSYHQKINSSATMLLIRDKKIPFENSIFIDKDCRIRYVKERPENIKGLTMCRFLGVHILNPEVFPYLPDNGCINKLTYPELLSENFIIYGYVTDQDSYDIGNPENLYRTNMAFLKGRYYSKIFTLKYIKKVKDKNGNIICEGSRIERSTIKNSIIAENCSISNSRITDSLIFPQSNIADSRIKRGIANDKYKCIIKSQLRR